MEPGPLRLASLDHTSPVATLALPAGCNFPKLDDFASLYRSPLEEWTA
jgi:hypothetical protein